MAQQNAGTLGESIDPEMQDCHRSDQGANTDQILQANLENGFTDNVKAWEVTTALDGLTVDRVDTDLYEWRNQLCGSEEGNGFEA